MTKIKRYKVETLWSSAIGSLVPVLRENPEGDLVTFIDHEKIVKTLERKVRRKEIEIENVIDQVMD